MSVQSLVDKLRGQLDRYDADYQSIMSDKRYNQDYRNRQITALIDSVKPEVIATATDLWGVIENNNTPDGSYQLSDNGTVWRELKSKGDAFNQAREQAEQVDPAQMQYALLRVQSLIEDAKRDLVPPERLLEEYEQGTTSIRIAFQDFSGLLNLDKSAKGAMFRDRLNRDRAARVNTPAVQAAQTAIDNTISAGATAYELTHRAANSFAPTFDPSPSNYLGRVMDNVIVNRQYVNEGMRQGFQTSIIKKQWGVRWTSMNGAPVFAGNGQGSNA